MWTIFNCIALETCSNQWMWTRCLWAVLQLRATVTTHLKRPKLPTAQSRRLMSQWSRKSIFSNQENELQQRNEFAMRTKEKESHHRNEKASNERNKKFYHYFPVNISLHQISVRIIWNGRHSTMKLFHEIWNEITLLNFFQFKLCNFIEWNLQNSIPVRSISMFGGKWLQFMNYIIQIYNSFNINLHHLCGYCPTNILNPCNKHFISVIRIL